MILDSDTAAVDGSQAAGFVPRRNANLVCPVCSSGEVKCIQVLPLAFGSLQRAIELRKQYASQSGLEVSSQTSPSLRSVNSSDGTSAGKRGREDPEELAIEASHIVYSQGKIHQTLASNLPDSESHRTGRWTDEEVAFVDHLVRGFDNGELPIPQGTKLSAFLGGILSCKASRLTKKMKNAKLSTRSYNLQKSSATKPINMEECKLFSNLQEQFLAVLPYEYQKLELQFNIAKQWREFFSDLCVEVGNPFLDGSLFIASLEEYERLGSNAEEMMRNVRRRRMGFNLRSESIGGTSPTNSSVNSKPCELNKLRPSVFTPNTIPTIDIEVPHQATSLGKDSDLQLFSSRGSLEKSQPANVKPEVENLFGVDTAATPLDDFKDFMKLMEGDQEHFDSSNHSFGIFPPVNSARDPFLEAIAMYLEKYNLPYQHADVWVPSFANENTDEDVQLMHAGYVTRRDQDGRLWSAFENFGEYSKQFKFKPGVGLVGRVYASGKTMWEFQVNELDSAQFLRAGGAKEYGVRTATGFSFATPGVGRMVVILYSSNHIQQNDALAHQCASELSRFSPEPKWKLVIEIGDDKTPPPVPKEKNYQVMDHFSHGEKLAPSADAVGRVATKSSADSEVHNIISLLGEQLASQSLDDSKMDDHAAFFQHFMSIRLMLLRPATKRSLEENEKIDVLTSSYKAYSAGNTRSGRELATLLAREWLCLAGTTGRSQVLPSSPATQVSLPPSAHQVHEMSPALPPAGVGKPTLTGMALPPVQLRTAVPATFIDQSMIVHDHSISLPSATPNETFGTSFLETKRHAMPRTVSCSLVPQDSLKTKQ